MPFCPWYSQWHPEIFSRIHLHPRNLGPKVNCKHSRFAFERCDHQEHTQIEQKGGPASGCPSVVSCHGLHLWRCFLIRWPSPRRAWPSTVLRLVLGVDFLKAFAWSRSPPPHHTCSPDKIGKGTQPSRTCPTEPSRLYEWSGVPSGRLAEHTL
jgi:hypothetical protein